ncbi:MAG: M17 family peptidase N-terminal domain-containing protein [Propionicimonas sp.]|uniref:leucyl aminopeptidase family protein n=1 Tax=Propionicimonas sp. TaxID=1955623 RepID=UPI002B1F9C0A|nr:M17 family peptidase N-terminal domain-containing protein [Propionicimonas sp.]MEA4944863.1 M17 family peptidase N-terminal domain-containing protein [Propionicimonas sp.]MEA5116469.1 M17 family peptidase N-terminal domain-containing protein [Propionicimonas sp.]
MTHAAPYPPFVLPQRALRVGAAAAAPEDVGAIGHIVFAGQTLDPLSGLSLDRAAALGFKAQPGETLVLTSAEGPVNVLIGGGDPGAVTTAVLRDLASYLARAVPGLDRLALVLPRTELPIGDAAAAVVEGAALARYVYRIGTDGPEATLASFDLIVSDEAVSDAATGATRGLEVVKAAKLARDLAGTPGGILTAMKLAGVASELGPQAGLEVEIFDEPALVELGCGGLLGINLGSAEPPAMIKLVYRPDGEPTGRLTLVGKGIMYDAGGLALKPGDEIHATMKNDMSGAAAILGAMTALRALGCRAQVTGYLMCTDNMPSGSALRLGDIVVMRGGKTVEVINTDAEGRMVMADALVLATEEPVDAIVDIATLTGAAMRTLGTEIAAVLGNNDALLDQVKAAAERVDEPVWELPLARRYRPELNSPIADLRNMGGVNAGSITAALFLEEFVAGKPWVHIDIAGTAQSGAARKWLNHGPTGFGTRLLLDLALNFSAA